MALPQLSLDASRWLGQRTLQELFLIGAALAVVAIAVVITAVWRPLAQARASAIYEIERAETLVAHVRAAAPRLRARGLSAEPVPPARAITESATSFGMTIRRIEQEGAGTRVVLDDADFAAMINWLVALERDSALRVTAIELERRPAPGIVSARLMLRN